MYMTLFKNPILLLSLLFNKNEINRMKNEIKDISEFTSQTLGYNPTNNW